MQIYQFFPMSQKSCNSRINFSMDISVIIVNYRVPYFLELCLHSVTKALKGLDAEIIVVDNDSGDGGVDWLGPLFPDIKWIVNTENTGFARANNQALRQSTGDNLLFLNPDTIVPEDFAKRCLNFFLSSDHPDPSDPPELPGWPGLGGLGVRMIDGSGNFLKESRRGLPTPWVAFCKLTGLSSLFPRSRLFSEYYLGYFASDDHTYPTRVLSGACLWVSRAALDSTGPFDENFFMYAEDIDLSYRLEKAGYLNYYFADTTIIHFKGESTQKDIRYIHRFYKAMIQFRRKHFSAGPHALPGVLMESAIWLRAGLGAIGHSIAAPRRHSKPRRTWLTGDPAGIARLRAALAATGEGWPPSLERTAASDEEDADEIIFCIGDEFTFQSAIEALEKKDPARSAAFYAAGCHAVVSSSRRDGKGEIWIL
jgi:N-acetylglucosaminyl-diphospho-decaprenol L-rhamnosyltransferase